MGLQFLGNGACKPTTLKQTLPSGCGFRPMHGSCVPDALTQCSSRARGFEPAQRMHSVHLQAYGVHTHNAVAWIPACRSPHMVCVHPVISKGLQIPPHKECARSVLTWHSCLASVSRPMVCAHSTLLCGSWPMEHAHLMPLPAALVWPASPSPRCAHTQLP